MLNTYVIYADLPLTVKGMLVRTFDEEECFNVVINSRLNAEQRLAAYMHELEHYKAKDFEAVDASVDYVEYVRHL